MSAVPRDRNDREMPNVGSRGHGSVIDRPARKEYVNSKPVSSDLLYSSGAPFPDWMTNPKLLPKRPPGK